MCSRPSRTTTPTVNSSRPRRRSSSAGRGHLRLSDRERDRAAETLRDHAAAGRLTLDELSDRLQAALRARTRAELDEQFADLPQAPARRNRHQPATMVGTRISVAAYVCGALAMIAIWAATGSGYFWPVWPIMGWGIGVMSRLRAGGVAVHRGGRDDPPARRWSSPT